MSNAFSNFIAQEQESIKSANFGGEVERYKPKRDIIRLDKKNTSIYVRILPGIKSQDNPEGIKFSSGFRNVFLNYKKSDGQVKSSGLTLPVGESVLDRFISQWLENNVQFNQYNQKPSLRYYINVIPLQVQDRNFIQTQDQQGSLNVHPMEITKTLYEALLEKLKDDFLVPTDDSNLSFISENHAFPVRLYRTGEKTDTTYHVEVYRGLDLGQLPNGWEQECSDLKEMTKPTEESIPSFVNYIINSLNGTENTTKNFDFEDDFGNSNQPELTQEQVDNQVPFNMQQPPQQDFNQFQQAPTQTQPQPNQQSNNPFANFNPNELDDTQVPFPTQEPQQQQQPVNTQPVQNQQPTQNVQQPQPQQEQPSIPKEQQQQAQQKQSQPKPVDDILSGMDLGL